MVYADANCLLRFILNDNEEMADYTENLLNTQEVFLLLYADTKLDFVDCILLSYFKTNNIQVATFDKKLKNKMK